MTRFREAASPVEAYDQGAEAWSAGVDQAYRRFGSALVMLAPPSWVGATVVDVAAGTGAVSWALRRLGAQPVAVDGAPAMLAVARREVPGLRVVVGDALRLPLGRDSVEGATIGFCINHVPEPWLLLAEAARAVRPGGTVLASTFARGPDHPAKSAVDEAAHRFGWRPSTWYRTFRDHASHSDTPELLAACAARAGLVETAVSSIDVGTGIDTTEALVAWRLGMPELAAFTRTLDERAAARLHHDAAAAVGPDPLPLLRQVLLLSATSASSSSADDPRGR